tara:strand:- start:539 stop:778 length:240 start_codon:yes stop_codon:yes gene_type:complete
VYNERPPAEDRMKVAQQPTGKVGTTAVIHTTMVQSSVEEEIEEKGEKREEREERREERRKKRGERREMRGERREKSERG